MSCPATFLGDACCDSAAGDTARRMAEVAMARQRNAARMAALREADGGIAQTSPPGMACHAPTNRESQRRERAHCKNAARMAALRGADGKAPAGTTALGKMRLKKVRAQTPCGACALSIEP